MTDKYQAAIVGGSSGAQGADDWGAVMTGAEIDCLVALVERGPLWDGDVPSKSGRDSLIQQGMACRVVVAGRDGYTAATYYGRDAYKNHFGTALGGEAGTIEEAKASRIARAAISSVRGGL